MRCHFFCLLATFLHAFGPAYSEDELSQFQTPTIQIPPKDNNFVLRANGTFISSDLAFEGEGYRDGGVVRFTLKPSAKRQLRFPWGAGFIQFPDNPWLAQRLHENIAIKSCPIQSGRILPLFGWLYKVSALTDDARGGNGVGITLEKLPKKQWPKGVTLAAR
jgi:hypothetical protein